MACSTLLFVGLVEMNAHLRSLSRRDPPTDLQLSRNQACFVIDTVDPDVGQHIAWQLGAALGFVVNYIYVQDFHHFDIATITTAEPRSASIRVIDPMGLLGHDGHSGTLPRDCAAETLKQFDGVTALSVVCAVDFLKNLARPERITELEPASFTLDETYIVSLFRDPNLSASFRLAFGSGVLEDVFGAITFTTESNVLGPSIAIMNTTPAQSQLTVTSGPLQINGHNGVYDQDRVSPSDRTHVSSRTASSVSASSQQSVNCHIEGCRKTYKQERFLREHLRLKHDKSVEQASAEAGTAFRNIEGRRGRNSRSVRRHGVPLSSTPSATRNIPQAPTVDSDILQIATDVESIGQQFHSAAIGTVDLGSFDAHDLGLEALTPYHSSLLPYDEDYPDFDLPGNDE